MASYAIRYGKEMEIVIASFDSDFFQLIGENVKVLRYRGDKTQICDREYLQEKFGIEPCCYADFKSLTGDNADNIKGAYKIGPKTAAKLINEFGSIQGLLGNAEKIKSESVKNSILEAKERLLKNCLLITLNDRAELPFTLEELSFADSGVKTGEVLQAIGLR